MNERDKDYIPERTDAETDSDMAQPKHKQPLLAGPRAAFVAPKLVKAGDLADITAGFSSTHFP